jgi:starvation-inducible DNA-binding protein
MNTSVNVGQFKNSEAKQPMPVNATREAAKDWDIVVALNQSLAHAIDLRSRTKQAYWSAKGGNFYTLHKMFNDFSADLDSATDELAARVMALGGTPVRTISIVAKTSKLPPYPTGIVQASEHLDALVASYEAASNHLPAVMKRVVQAGDHSTASIVTGFAKMLDEQVGFFTAHIPAEWVTSSRKQSLS